MRGRPPAAQGSLWRASRTGWPAATTMLIAKGSEGGGMLNFQVAGAQGGYLLEHLLVESIGAVRGGGIFAWANVAGAKVLFEDETFQEFLAVGDFRLFVGTDTITDTAAVQKLTQIEAKQPRFTARAFLSPDSSLFHPKLAWFEHDDHLSVVVGSGNLTMGGLRSNWEAFVVERLKDQAALAALESIQSFITAQAANLAPLTDQRVLERVMKNSGNERSLRNVTKPSTTSSEIKHSIAEVLVTEMNRTEARLAQANFKLQDYEGFFGALRGTQRRISLRLIDPSGVVGDIQSRPSVEAKSKNYRFELDGLKDAHLRSQGRPIGVFARLSTGEFVYSFVGPGDEGFAQLDAMLGAQAKGSTTQLRRIRIAAGDLATAWPSASILSADLPAL